MIPNFKDGIKKYVAIKFVKIETTINWYWREVSQYYCNVSTLGAELKHRFEN